MKGIGDESTAVVGATPFPHNLWEPYNYTLQLMRAIASRYDLYRPSWRAEEAVA